MMLTTAMRTAWWSSSFFDSTLCWMGEGREAIHSDALYIFAYIKQRLVLARSVRGVLFFYTFGSNS